MIHETFPTMCVIDYIRSVLTTRNKISTPCVLYVTERGRPLCFGLSFPNLGPSDRGLGYKTWCRDGDTGIQITSFILKKKRIQLTID